MRPLLVIAGLSVEAFDALRKQSEKRFSPNGRLFSRPVKRPGYPAQQANQFISEMAEAALQFREDEQVASMVAFVDHGDVSTETFVNRFFPFALARPIEPMHLEANLGAAARNRAIAAYVEYLYEEAVELRRRSALIREQTDVHNITPLLLPTRNFRSRHYEALLERLYGNLGVVEDPQSLLKREIEEFKRHHPRVHPPEDDRTCFSDGSLFFRSPGRARHGYYRHDRNGGHLPACLLNARTRFGGSYDHRFHYDCVPVRKLAAAYPNCHDAPTPPKERHVNIAPNDFVI